MTIQSKEEMMEMYPWAPAILWDNVPRGWRQVLYPRLLEGIEKAVAAEGTELKDLKIYDVNTTFGGLRIVHNGDFILNALTNHFFDYSRHYCVECGQPSRWMRLGSQLPYCDSCRKACRDGEAQFRLLTEKDKARAFIQ